MRKLFASLLTLASVTPIFWATVAPHGKELCASDTAFNYHPLDENGKAAGVKAKVQFCTHIKNS